MRQSRQALLLAAVWCLAVASVRADKPSNPLVGKWKHASGKITLEIEPNRLHILADQPGNDDLLSLHADYGLTRDLTVYGLFTRVEGKKESLLDKPFSFRVRVEDGCLVIRDAYIGCAHAQELADLDFLHGVYHNAATPIANKAEPKSEKPPTPMPSSEVLVRSIPTPVPSCRLQGNRLENLALCDFDGKVWEYRRDRRGRLLLLDFWYHNCSPCLLDIPKLVALKSDFGPYGLEVVSIACETGSLETQRQNVRAIRNRYQANYTMLLSGGGQGRCPVVEQFQVTYFPMLVLIDQDGTILWRSNREGMDDHAHQQLRKMIQDKLIPNAKKEAH